MTIIRVIPRKAAAPEAAELERLRDQWTAAGSRLETGALTGTCSIEGCRTMPFVTVRTATGRRALCLRHFERMHPAAA